MSVSRPGTISGCPRERRGRADAGGRHPPARWRPHAPACRPRGDGLDGPVQDLSHPLMDSRTDAKSTDGHEDGKTELLQVADVLLAIPLGRGEERGRVRG